MQPQCYVLCILFGRDVCVKLWSLQESVLFFLYLSIFQGWLVLLTVISAQESALCDAMHNPTVLLAGQTNCWTLLYHMLVLIVFIHQNPRHALELALLAGYLFQCMKDDAICGLFPVQYFGLYWIVFGSSGV